MIKIMLTVNGVDLFYTNAITLISLNNNSSLD